MAKNHKSDTSDRKLMTSFFSIQQTLDEFRDVSPESLALLSLEDQYNLIIECIDLVRFIRKSQSSTMKRSRLNRGMKVVTPSFSNVGGLVSVKVRANPIVAFSRTEKENLTFVQEELIRLKNELLEDEFFLTSLPLRFIIEERTIVSRDSKRKVSKRNAHFSKMRRKSK